MKGAFQIARLFNIPVRIHWTFVLVIVWVIYNVRVQEGTYNWTSILLQTLFVLLLFTCVVLHEFGHALTARKYGVKTLDIILSPIGGVARLDRMPDKPIQEFWVAIAGPLVNFAIILLLAGFLVLFRGIDINAFRNMLELVRNPNSNVFLTPLDQTIFILILINFVLAAFNLLPAFPLDGGRIFRALLSIRFGRLRATRIASLIGQVFAVLLLVYGLWQSQFITAFIGFFVFTTATGEYRSVKWETALNQYFVKDILQSQFKYLTPENSLSEAIALLEMNNNQSFLIIDPHSHKVVGAVETKTLKANSKKNPPGTLLSEIARPLPAILNPEDSLRVAYHKMQQTQISILPVIEFDELIGILTMKDIEQFVGKLGK